MNTASRVAAAMLGLLLAAGLAPTQSLPVAQAQTQPSPGASSGTVTPQPRAKIAVGAQGAAKPAPKTDATADPAAAPAPAKADGSAQLRQRIDQLEEQVNEMHVAVGTLESFARTGAGKSASQPAGPSGGLTSDAAARIDGLEGKLRTMSAQIEQIAQQVRALEGRGPGAQSRPQERGDVVTPPATSRVAGAAEAAPRGDGIGGLIRGPGNDRSTDVGSAPLPPVGGSIGGPVGGAAGTPPGTPTVTPSTPRQQPASLPAGNPKEMYERAYGNLLQQDYGAAELAFAEFLAQHASHELAGNAQYWLGESHYVRQQYRPAANAFLKGYQSYPKSQKAADSLLKLGMSLDRLGQKEAACSSLGELTARFPSAPAHVQSRAQSERARIGC